MALMKNTLYIFPNNSGRAQTFQRAMLACSQGISLLAPSLPPILRREGLGFPRAGRAAPSDFPRKSRGGALPAEEISVLSESFTKIYILFLIGEDF